MPVKSVRRFGYWRDPVFLICLATYAINREIIKPLLSHYFTFSHSVFNENVIAFFHGHLNDSLTVPVALPIYLYVYRLIGLRPDDKAPRWWEVFLHSMVWMVFFEWFGPVILNHGTYDPTDDWCIAIGGIVAWLIWWREYRPPPKKVPFP